MFPWYSGRGHQIGYRFWDARAQRNHTDCWISRATPTDVCGEKHSRCSVSLARVSYRKPGLW